MPTSKKWKYIDEVVLRFQRDECLIWPFYRMRNGYAPILIPKTRRKALVSRVICEEVNGPPPTQSHEAAHSCGNGHLGCVAPGHLSWKTPAQNQADRVEHGTSNRGERQWMAKLTPEKVTEIRRQALAKRPQQEIAAQFGIEQSWVSRIATRKSWAWLP